jgi:uncharacterized protein
VASYGASESRIIAVMQIASTPTEQTVVLNTDTGDIYGTLVCPVSSGKIPIALIIAGSGATDRNGNHPGIQGHNDSLKMLALVLANGGIASVRYDKRGIGASALAVANEVDLRIETYAQDAIAWVTKLAGDSRFSGVAILGHSEGSLIGVLAANQCAARSFVSIAGVAYRASTLLRNQLQGKLPTHLLAINETILAALEVGELVDNIPSELFSLYRPSVQPYLISWFNYTPAIELKKLRIPCLILQGDTDIQVPLSEAQALHAAKPDSEIYIVQGMNHLLKTAPPDQAQQIASYNDLVLPISPALGHELIRFLSSTMGHHCPNGAK